MDKFFNKKDIPWVNLVWEKHYSNVKLPSRIKKGSFWWRDILKLLDKFKGMASITVLDEKMFSFGRTYGTSLSPE